MAVYVRLKNEFTEDEKYHNVMSWLKCASVEDTNWQFELWFMVVALPGPPISFF